jgi:hypothetical protein
MCARENGPRRKTVNIALKEPDHSSCYRAVTPIADKERIHEINSCSIAVARRGNQLLERRSDFRGLKKAIRRRWPPP